MAGWWPLPFPECPTCRATWRTCAHRGCPACGDVEADSVTRQARCGGCGLVWALDTTVFHCACGWRFTAPEVRDALSTAAIMRRRLIDQIESMSAADLTTRRAAHDSLSGWLETVAAQLGEVLGRAVGRAVRWWRELT